MVAYHAGLRCFGENHVQELLLKKNTLPADIEWHMIGHLQGNKVKQIVPFIGMLQSVDSLKLLRLVNNESARINRITRCLLQFHIAREETKFGFDLEDIVHVLESEDYRSLSSVRICGVMGMATFTDNLNVVRSEFVYLRNCFNALREKFFTGDTHFTEISMGMSDDFRIAIEEGSTMIRIGTGIFGDRE